MSDLFTVEGRESQADTLAKKLPDGQAFDSKYIGNSVLRQWLIALGLELSRLEEYMNYTHNQMVLEQTTDLLEDFEKDYGMNANCFKNSTGTTQERINNILTLILSNGTSTEEQFEELGALMGFDIDVSSNSFTAPDLLTDRFVIYVKINAQAPTIDTFPYDWAFPFVSGGQGESILICFFNVLKPAHTIIDFSYTS